jgi:hypothetical protein
MKKHVNYDVIQIQITTTFSLERLFASFGEDFDLDGIFTGPKLFSADIPRLSSDDESGGLLDLRRSRIILFNSPADMEFLN